MAQELTDARGALLSTLPAGPKERRLALIVVLLSTAIFLAAAPFATTPLPPVPAFLPVYESALILNDAITAVLLYGQYNILRSRALLILAGAYLFSALMATAHMLSFPGLFAAGGLLSGGAQTTAWLYFLWHAVFPFCVIAYAYLKNGTDAAESATKGTGPGPAIAASIVTVLAIVGALVALTTAGHDAMPAIMQGDRDAPAKFMVAALSWMASLIALVVLWRRQRSLLDLWLMVVMCVWIFDIALAAVLNAGRYDLGWYAGRVYGLLASSFVLGVLLLENSMLYARLAEAYAGERRERQRAEEKSAELAAVNKELDSFSYSVSHDLRAPLRAVIAFARMVEEDYGARLDAEGRRLLGVVRESAQRMGQLIEDLLQFARLGRQPLRTRRVELNELVDQTIAELVAAREDRRIRFDIKPLGPVEGDPTLLKQALVNLISNAMKFTRDKDPALIEVGREAETPATENGHVYYVKDNGAGFDMTYYEKLFGVFQRLHRQEDFEGTGVGLAIVHKVITRHGGRVWANSAPGSGATFYFTLPAAQA
jgi:signal transduction histidine kinase